MSLRKQYNSEYKAKVALEALKNLHAKIGEFGKGGIETPIWTYSNPCS